MKHLPVNNMMNPSGCTMTIAERGDLVYPILDELISSLPDVRSR